MKKIMLILFAGLMILSFSTTSCTSKNDLAYTKLDSLDLLLETSNNHLSLDLEMIQARVRDMESNRSQFFKLYTDTMDLERGIQLDRHKGVMKQYNKAIKDHATYTKEYAALQKQVEDLRRSYRKKEMSKEEFKNFYRTEASDVNQLHRNTQQLQSSLYEIEPEYYRLSDLMSEWLKALEGEQP